jgi:transglutaminase-like putative cysteine protease
MQRFLAASAIIDWHQPALRELADRLRGGDADDVAVARRCFEWVRDRILHTSDHHLDPVTCAASEVLTQGTGFCYSKSHLLAALLRANGIPAGFVYQRLSLGEGQFCLHGLNAVWIPQLGWYRLDARGSRPDLSAEFAPPTEHLPFSSSAAGECTFVGIWAEPIGVVVAALQAHRHREALLEHLPDAQEHQIPELAVARWRQTP